MTPILAYAQAPAGVGLRTALWFGHVTGIRSAVLLSAKSSDAVLSGRGKGTALSGEAGRIVLADAASSPGSVAVPSQVIGNDPAIGNDTVSRDYLRSARADLVAGRTVAAQQSLALAQRRALDQAAVSGRTATPNTGLFIARIIDARQALEHGDSHYAIALIDVALLH
jgi:hypothetical protein